MSNADTPTAHPIIKPQLERLASSRSFVRMLVEGLTDKQMLTRTCSGGNHPLWCLGHIAVTEQFIFTSAGDGRRVLPAKWDALFQGGSKPVDDAAAYPTPSELMSGADAMRDALVRWLSALDEEKVQTRITGDLQPFAGSFAQLGSSFVLHESFHAGQISAARRAMGLPPLF